ncbi:MAG TPA: hypothetical protein ENH06_00810 [bacterium]|nr:hypothetical protein [bacterium]
MEEYDIKNKAQLLDLIGAGVTNPKESGPVVIKAKIWDGRIVRAIFKTKIEKIDGKKYMVGDVEIYDDIFFDLKPLVPFVDKMLSTGESFFTVTGTDDMVCSLQWTIQ